MPGADRRNNGQWLLMGMGFWVRNIKTVLKLDGGDSCTTLNILIATTNKNEKYFIQI